jgi:hypothetical protein
MKKESQEQTTKMEKRKTTANQEDEKRKSTANNQDGKKKDDSLPAEGMGRVQQLTEHLPGHCTDTRHVQRGA